MKTAKICTKENITNSQDGQIMKKFGSGRFLKNMAEKGAQDSTKDGDNYLSDVDTDLNNIFLCLQGRVRFGDGVSGARGENISGEFVRFTSPIGANTEFAVPHHLGTIPVGYICLWNDMTNGLYQGPTTGTHWTTTNIYLKCEHSNCEHLMFILK